MYNITLIPGDGIGPEVIGSAMKVIEASGVKINWEKELAGENAANKIGTVLPQRCIESIKKNKVALKGPVSTPIGGGFRSVNVELRKTFDLYSNIRPVRTLEGIASKYCDIDIVVFRENTEDLYTGIEFMVNPDIAQSVKIISRKGSERIGRSAFEFARKNGRKKVTCVHKANIMKLSDGLFIKCIKEVSKEYPDIEYNEEIVDALCMNLVIRPQKYDILVLPNLYGDIVSDLCAGLVGGLGMVPGANIGEDAAVFEPVHGSAHDIAGKNIANPSAAILSGCLMLDYLGEFSAANNIRLVLEKTIKECKIITSDIGGKASTDEFTQEIIRNMHDMA